MMTLYHLRCPSGCPVDYTLYTMQTSQLDNIQSMDNMCPLIRQLILLFNAIGFSRLLVYKYTRVTRGFGVFLDRSFYSPLLCDQNEPLVMPNGQVLAKLWSKKIRKKIHLNVVYNDVIVVPILHILIPDKRWMGKHLL
jgi:hypothetical protein